MVIMLIENPGVLIQSFLVEAFPCILTWPPVSVFHGHDVVCEGLMVFLVGLGLFFFLTLKRNSEW